MRFKNFSSDPKNSLKSGSTGFIVSLESTRHFVCVTHRLAAVAICHVMILRERPRRNRPSKQGTGDGKFSRFVSHLEAAAEGPHLSCSKDVHKAVNTEIHVHVGNGDTDTPPMGGKPSMMRTITTFAEPSKTIIINGLDPFSATAPLR